MTQNTILQCGREPHDPGLKMKMAMVHPQGAEVSDCTLLTLHYPVS